MSSDLTSILEDWPYEPGQINVRLIEGDQGDPKIQMRLDLGILQMEVSGRPDGQRPNGCESLLEYFESVLDERVAGAQPPRVVESDGSDDEDGPDAGQDPASGDEGPAPEMFEGDDAPAGAGGEFKETGKNPRSGRGGPGPGRPGDAAGEGELDPSDPHSGGEVEFTLSPDDCRQLREEAVQYYHRYISLLVLGDYQGVLRDTSRNLRVLDLCRDYAEGDEDREVLEQFRSYLIMMRVRAVASQAIADDEPKVAMWSLDEGLEQLRKMYDEQGRGAEYEGASEVQLLRGMRDELVKKLPASQKQELLVRLQDAIDKENYELAAILRDELKTLKE